MVSLRLGTSFAEITIQRRQSQITNVEIPTRAMVARTDIRHAEDSQVRWSTGSSYSRSAKCR